MTGHSDLLSLYLQYVLVTLLGLNTFRNLLAVVNPLFKIICILNYSYFLLINTYFKNPLRCELSLE